jgi:acyl carrier protein
MENKMDNLQHKDIVEQLINYTKNSYGLTKDISGDMDLLALGLDSLDILNYLLFLEEKYGLEIGNEQLGEGGALIFNETAKMILSS